MVDIERQEQPKAERIIQLGEEFHPFDPKYVKRKMYSLRNVESFYIGIPHVEEFYSPRIALDIENKYRVFSAVTARYGLPNYYDRPVGILHQDYKGVKKHNVLTPFNSKSGYQINSRDFDATRRLDKVKAILGGKTREQRQHRDVDVPLILSAGAYSEYPAELPIPMVLALRMQVFFGEKSFEAGPAEAAQSGGKIAFQFNHFYPTDKGPLSVLELDHPEYSIENLLEYDLGVGLHIFLPSDSERLSQIGAKFVLAEQEPQKA